MQTQQSSAVQQLASFHPRAFLLLTLSLYLVLGPPVNSEWGLTPPAGPVAKLALSCRHPHPHRAGPTGGGDHAAGAGGGAERRGLQGVPMAPQARAGAVGLQRCAAQRGPLPCPFCRYEAGGEGPRVGGTGPTSCGGCLSLELLSVTEQCRARVFVSPGSLAFDPNDLFMALPL